jgi:hypothetical protein
VITSFRRLVRSLVVVGATAFMLASPVAAQSDQTQSVEAQLGASDFRTAPVLGDGSYVDTAVPEETVWYAFRTSQPEQSVTASAAITDAQLADQLGVTLTVVGPDLVAVAESVSGSIEQVLAFSQTNREQSTTWYLTVRTSTGGSRLADAVVPLSITLGGADAADLEPCSAVDCRPAADADRLLADIAEAEARLESKAIAAQAAATPMSEDDRLQLHNRRRELTDKIEAQSPTPSSPPKGTVLGAALASVFIGYLAATRIPSGRIRRPLRPRIHTSERGEQA